MLQEKGKTSQRELARVQVKIYTNILLCLCWTILSEFHSLADHFHFVLAGTRGVAQSHCNPVTRSASRRVSAKSIAVECGGKLQYMQYIVLKYIRTTPPNV